jgi:hypothetical protein
MDSARAEQILDSLEQISRETRRVRHSYWFPLTLFGAVILGALPFDYYSLGHYSAADGPVTTYHSSGPPSVLDRLGFGAGAGLHPWGAALFWLISVPLAYAAVAIFYRIRASRTGVQGRVWPFVVTGLVLFAFLLATAPGVVLLLHAPEWLVSWQSQMGDLYSRGLTPIIVISIALFVLARLERSWGLFWIALAFFPIALLANLYNISNAFYRIHHWIVPDWAANLAVAGGFLVFFGAVSLIGQRVVSVRHGASS